MLNLTNYSDHPTRIGYTVFRFKEKKRAEHFETLLKKDNIGYESSTDDKDNLQYYFGIKKGDIKRAMNANYLVSAKYRNRTISNNYIGLGVLIFVAAIIIIAIIGAIKT